MRSLGRRSRGSGSVWRQNESALRCRSRPTHNFVGNVMLDFGPVTSGPRLRDGKRESSVYDDRAVSRSKERCEQLDAVPTALRIRARNRHSPELGEAGAISRLITPILVGPVGEDRRDRPDPRELTSAIRQSSMPCIVKTPQRKLWTVWQGKAELLMKGSLNTDELLRPVVARETGLRQRPARPAARAVEPLQRPDPEGRAGARLPDLELDGARRVAVRRARAAGAPRDLLRARARGLRARRDALRRLGVHRALPARGAVLTSGSGSARSATCRARAASARVRRRSRRSSRRSRRRGSRSAARREPTTRSRRPRWRIASGWGTSDGRAR